MPTVTELRAALKAAGAVTTGTKPELEERLAALDTDGPELDVELPAGDDVSEGATPEPVDSTPADQGDHPAPTEQTLGQDVGYLGSPPDTVPDSAYAMTSGPDSPRTEL